MQSNLSGGKEMRSTDLWMIIIAVVGLALIAGIIILSKMIL